MKHICYTLLFIALATTTTSAQLAFEGGYNVANMSVKSEGAKFSTTAVKGVDIGIFTDISVDIKRHFYFQPGLVYESGGCVVTKPFTGNYDLNIADLHLNVEYKSGQKCGTRFILGGGPVIIYYNSGSYSLDSIAPKNKSVSTHAGGDLKIGSLPGDDIKKRGLGFGINVGVQLKRHTYFRAYLQQGISNVKAVGNPDNKVKTSAMGINIGYLIARCNKRKHVAVYEDAKPNHWRGMSKGVYSRRPKYWRRSIQWRY